MTTEEGIPVLLPSGATFYVLTDAEKEYIEDKIERYLSDNHFVNVSDMLDIDKMVTYELLHHRWVMWVSRQCDYWGEEVNVKALADLAESYSGEIRQLKKALGVDKTTRDRTSGDDSVAARWDNVLQRAREFGYMRNRQAITAIEKMHRIAAVMTVHKNMDEIERREFGFELDDVFEIIEDVVKEYKEIDEEFKMNVQRYWIRSQ